MKSMSILKFRFPTAVVLTVILAATIPMLSGCSDKGGGGEIVPVQGTVKYKGKPVSDATVTFFPVGGGRTASGSTDANGKFQLTTVNTNDGASVGEHKIAIVMKTNAGQMGGDEGPQSADAYGLPKPGDKAKVVIPSKYAEADTSELKRTVADDGKNDFTIDLK